MKKILILALVALCSVSVYAQKKVLLRAGTVIPMKSVSEVKARDVNEGETVDFRVNTNIMVGDDIAIPFGTLVKGTVTRASRSTIAGTKGKLAIDINQIVLPSGELVLLTNSNVYICGKNRTPLAVVLGIFTEVGIFITGSKAVMPEGYDVYGYVAGNVEVTVQ